MTCNHEWRGGRTGRLLKSMNPCIVSSCYEILSYVAGLVAIITATEIHDVREPRLFQPAHIVVIVDPR
jgi:hypothetical protein